MRKNKKSSISKASSYKEIGEFWDKHSLSEFRDKTRKTSFDVDIVSEITYFAIDKEISEQIHSIAKKRGIPAGTLLNLWVQEKILNRRHL